MKLNESLQKQLDETMAELRGLRAGRAKDGSPIGSDAAFWDAIALVLAHTFLARHEVHQARDHADKRLPMGGSASLGTGSRTRPVSQRDVDAVMQKAAAAQPDAQQ